MKPLFASLVVFFITNPTRADETAGNARTIEFLQKLQTTNGGFLSMPPAPNIRLAPTLRATTSAVRAIKYLGGKVANPDGAAKFIASCYDPKSGGFSEMPGGVPEVATTAVGILAVRELGLPLEMYADGAVKYLTDNAKSFDDIRIAAAAFEKLERKSPKADAWLAEVKKTRNADGTFGSGLGMARDTASAVVTQLRLGDKLDPRDKVLKALRDGQRGSGGFGNATSDNAADLESSYRVMRCFMMLKEQPTRVEGLRTFVAKCRNEDGGYALEPGEPSTVAATYYATIVRKWLD